VNDIPSPNRRGRPSRPASDFLKMDEDILTLTNAEWMLLKIVHALHDVLPRLKDPSDIERARKIKQGCSALWQQINSGRLAGRPTRKVEK
jgi:hypothetical protein